MDKNNNTPTQLATLGGGCFWCTEAVFQEVEGVRSVTSGYSGGTAETADYKMVCSGTTRHAEVVQVEFDPSQVYRYRLLGYENRAIADIDFLAADHHFALDRGTQHLHKGALFVVAGDHGLVLFAYLSA